MLCWLCHPSCIISHHIQHLQHHLHCSNHTQHVPSPPGQPLGLQLHFSFILGCSVHRSLHHPSSTISHYIQHLGHRLHCSNHTQCVPLPFGHPLGLQLCFGFILGRSMHCSLCHPSGTIPGTCGGHLVWLFFCPVCPCHLMRYLQV